MTKASTSALRWVVKKTARKSVALTSWAGAKLPLRHSRQARLPACRVLTYHRFDATPRDPFAVTPRAFRQQMAYLAKHDLAVSLAQVERHVDGSQPLARDAVLVTIDDGVQSVYDQALPVLRDFSIPAVLYVSPSLIGVGRKMAIGAGEVLVLDGPEPYLNWDELGGLAEAGVTIGSHAWTHRSLGGRPLVEVDDEAGRSRDELRRRLGIDATSFAYPFGTRADYNDDIAAALARAGYRSAFTSQHGRIVTGADPLQLPRIKVEGGEGLRMFRLLLAGGMDGWRYIDQTLWRLQARHG